MGKIWHENICEGAAVGEQAASWTQPYYHAPCISLGSIYNHTCYESYPGPLPEGPGGKVTSIYSNASVGSEDDMPDAMIAARAVATLHKIAKGRQAGQEHKPFFLAVGFHKPHLPHIAPQSYFDLYPLDAVSLPDKQTRHIPSGAPEGVWSSCSEFRTYKDVAAAAKQGGFSETTPFNDSVTRLQRRAYFACASFVDAQIGKVLTALDVTGLNQSTVVALWGDHGWHLGENNEWAKHTSMKRAHHTPLLFAVPGGSARVVDEEYAEFVVQKYA
jgi:iduronate 2-sulfatase